MKLELMNINYFVEKKNIKQVKSARIEGKGGKLDTEGLFSEVIFGRLGSPTRRLTFGYINLNVKVIHPEVWDFISGLNPMVGKLILGKKKFIITEKGNLEESPNQEFGISGIKALVDNWDKFNLSLIGKNKPENVKFLKKYKDSIFIDKMLVLPAGIRDVQLSKMTNKKLVTSKNTARLK